MMPLKWIANKQPFAIRICLTLDEQFDGLHITPLGRHVEGCSAVRGGDVHGLHVRLDECLHLNKEICLIVEIYTTMCLKFST